MKQRRRLTVSSAVACTLALLALSACGGSSTGGITDKEVKIASLLPLTGAAASYGPVFRDSEQAYYDYVNDHGGVNGRKISLEVLDSAFDPATSLAVAKRAVESNDVFAIVGTSGTPVIQSTYRYLESQQMPNMFFLTGAPEFDDPQNLPYTFPHEMSYGLEPEIFVPWIEKRYPGKKLGLLYENDAFGQAYLDPIKEIAGDSLVSTQSYDTTDTNLSSQIAALRSDGAQVLIEAVLPKYAQLAASAIRSAGWKAPVVISGNANDPSVLGDDPAIRDAGIMGPTSFPSLNDSSDPNVQFYKNVMAKYAPDVPLGGSSMMAFGAAQMFVEALKGAGENPTPEKLVAAAEEIQNDKHIVMIGQATINQESHSAFHCVRMTRITPQGAQKYLSPEICK